MGIKQLAAFYKYSVSPEGSAPSLPFKHWSGWSGGEMTRATTQVPTEDGIRTLAGKPTWSNIIIRSSYDPDDQDTALERLETAAAEGDPRYTLSRQPTTQNEVLRGKATKYTGCAIVAIRRPESADGTEATGGVLEIEFAHDGPSK